VSASPQTVTAPAPVTAPASNPALAREAAPAQVAGNEDKQIVVMRIEDLDYIPHQFTVKQGIPVEWRIDASEAAACGRFLIAPGLGIRRVLSDRSTTTISFVPRQVGEFRFNCGMGMMTPGSKFIVVPNERG
jgi:plastocyanin domain-containing protein